MAVTGASLSGIYDRLNNSSTRPMSASTFSDWSLEAGDRVTLTRDGQTYQGTVHNSSMSWKGKTPTVEINSTGNEKRDAVSKAEKKKYNRGGSGVRNDENMYVYEVNQDHLLYEVYDSQGRFSKLEVTVRGLYHEVYDTNGRFSKLQNTANGLYHEVYDTNGRFSKLQNTVNGLYHEVYDTNGRFSKLQNTANGLYHEVYDTNGRFSKLQNTANGLYHEVYGTNGSFSTLQNTVKGLYHEVYDPTTGLRTQVTTQAGAFSVLCSGTGANSKLKPAAIQAGIDAATGQSKILLSANNIVLDGNVVASAIRTADITVGGLDVTNGIECKAIDATIIDCTSLNTNGGDVIGGDADFDSLVVNEHTLGIYDITVSGNTMTIYKLDGTTIPFSKATTLTGGWDSGVYTVTASPQGNRNYTSLTNTGHWGVSANGENVNYYYYKTYATINGNATTYDTGNSTTINGTVRYNAGRAAVTLNEPTWNTVSSLGTSRTVTVSTTGRTNASGTTENLSKSVPLYLTKNNLTVSLRAGSEDGTIYALATCSDSDLKASNIKDGVTIFGVTGSLKFTESFSSVAASSYSSPQYTDSQGHLQNRTKIGNTLSLNDSNKSIIFNTGNGGHYYISISVS